MLVVQLGQVRILYFSAFLGFVRGICPLVVTIRLYQTMFVLTHDELTPELLSGPKQSYLHGNTSPFDHTLI